MANLNFDAASVEPSTALDPVPSAWYRGYMSKSEIVPTKNQDGAFIEAWFTITEPKEYAGRKVPDRINIQNKNPVAVEIGYRTLSAICHSVGVLQVQDTQQLHNMPLEFKVSLRPAGYGNNGQYYDASNEIKGYRAVTAGVIGPGSNGVPASTPQPPATQPGQTQPWQPPVSQQPPVQTPAQAWQPPAQTPAAPAQPWQPPTPQAPTQSPVQQGPTSPQQPTGTPPWESQGPTTAAEPSGVPPWQRG